jgi:hypothetical protein
MMQDWTWLCRGCGRHIEPYESHDVGECFAKHGTKPLETAPPLKMWERLIIFCLLASIGIVAIYLLRGQ